VTEIRGKSASWSASCIAPATTTPPPASSSTGRLSIPSRSSVRIVVSLNVGFWRLRYRIGTIHSEGLRLLSQPELHGFFEHCCLWFGRTSTERISRTSSVSSTTIKAKGYAGVRIAQREIRPNSKERVVDLDLSIEERKRIELHFLGRSELSPSDLRGAVTIFRDNYYSANELDESARNIHRLYQQRGFFEARVKWRWRNRSGDPVEVEFLIPRGPQLKVRDIEFAAGPAGKPLSYPAGKLEEQIRTRRYPRLGAGAWVKAALRQPWR
jgi:outer membrane protein assembly factor BamA